MSEDRPRLRDEGSCLPGETVAAGYRGDDDAHGRLLLWPSTSTHRVGG